MRQVCNTRDMILLSLSFHDAEAMHSVVKPAVSVVKDIYSVVSKAVSVVTETSPTPDATFPPHIANSCNPQAVPGRGFVQK